MKSRWLFSPAGIIFTPGCGDCTVSFKGVASLHLVPPPPHTARLYQHPGGELLSQNNTPHPNGHQSPRSSAPVPGSHTDQGHRVTRDQLETRTRVLLTNRNWVPHQSHEDPFWSYADWGYTITTTARLWETKTNWRCEEWWKSMVFGSLIALFIIIEIYTCLRIIEYWDQYRG